MQAAHLFDNILVKENMKHPSISLFYGDESIKEERTKYSIINPTLASRLKQDKILEQFLHLEDKTHP